MPRLEPTWWRGSASCPGGAPRVARLSPTAVARGLRRRHDHEVDGSEVASARELIERIRAAAGKPLTLSLERDGGTTELTLTPLRVVDEQGNPIGRIGAELNDRAPLIKVQYGPIESVGIAVDKTWDTAIFSLRMLGKMITGEASWRNLSGPVTIADYAGQTARIGTAAFLSFLVVRSASQCSTCCRFRCSMADIVLFDRDSQGQSAS
jgi:regulator of sigma E protease